MYKNLKAELVRSNISNGDIAKKLGITPGTASLKVNGKARVSLDEAFVIQDLIFEKSKTFIPIEELFRS
ncbi:MAG: XRE family transcriptional regulator [Firmicutes bacterium]|nr:XRE family transcriptional regulator [Bacillota bacterium]